MSIQFDIKEPSTKRGIVWGVASLVALIFLFMGSVERAVAVMGIAGTVAGGLGVALKDN